MKQTGKRKQASRLPQTIVIEFVPKKEVQVEDAVLEAISPSKRTAFLIEHGYPVAVIETDSSGEEKSRKEFNMENRADPPDYVYETLARCAYEAIQREMNTPEGKARFEEWKKQQAAEKNR